MQRASRTQKALTLTNSANMETIPSLCKRYRVDMAHARYVAELATQLFDATQAVHQLDARSRELVDAGAVLHNVGLTVDEAHHHTVGRDIVVGATLKGFNTAERNLLACIVSFHRKAVHPDEELLFRVLNEAQQRQCLILSALVRVADGLDESQTQTTAIAKVKLVPAGPDSLDPSDVSSPLKLDGIQIKVKGPHSYDDALRANKKADLWNHLFEKTAGELSCAGQLKTPGLALDDTLAVAGRKLMRYHFAQRDLDEWLLKWDDADPDKADGDGKAESKAQAALVKKLRIGLRRLRSTALAFGDYYRDKHTEKLFDGMRSFGRVLGAAREADMLLERAKDYADACDAEARGALEPFIQQLKSRREQAYQDVLNYAQKPAHQHWVDDFHAFVLARPGSKYDRELDVDTPSRVRHAARLMMWQYLASVRAFDVLPDLPDVTEVHALRIAIKRFRYVTQGLEEVLPADEVNAWVAVCKQAQDAYGAIQDAHMAAEDARQFARAAHDKGRGVHSKAIETYVSEQMRLVTDQLPNWRTALAPLLQDAPPAATEKKAKAANMPAGTQTSAISSAQAKGQSKKAGAVQA